MQTLIVFQLQSDHSAPLPKFLWNHKDFDFIAPGGDSAGGESSNGGGGGGGESDNKSSESDNKGCKSAPNKGKQHMVQERNDSQGGGVGPSYLKSQPAPQGDEDESSLSDANRPELLTPLQSLCDRVIGFKTAPPPLWPPNPQTPRFWHPSSSDINFQHFSSQKLYTV
ncbi:uncharacterized protein EI90DRAFT_3020865 [Cantharellus anzutake]|uniref:uncharacterized protein n=1 Tax=Cantharellus anzutake TaxID=1750568 RepID=UPI00190341C7|nr:uncharacterized protein EI90DRAFT_3020865 [Cantharellus anzutake]KAF8319163.1 hypothetical protein EI90DRAFT_3020865 [Cantharellus anzutake]